MLTGTLGIVTQSQCGICRRVREAPVGEDRGFFVCWEMLFELLDESGDNCCLRLGKVSYCEVALRCVVCIVFVDCLVELIQTSFEFCLNVNSHCIPFIVVCCVISISMSGRRSQAVNRLFLRSFTSSLWGSYPPLMKAPHSFSSGGKGTDTRGGG